MRRLDVDTALIVRRYAEGASGKTIAKELGCSDGVVYARLHALGVPRSAKASLPLEELIARYCAGESSTAIAASFSVATATIRRHLTMAGVDLRDDREGARTDVKPCPTSQTFRAYLLGLVWGDFSAEWATARHERLYVKSSTTHDAQRRLARLVFSEYGPVSEGGTTIRATLHPTFAFLLGKYVAVVPELVRREPCAAAFAAGYVDAEGSFGIYEGRARFKMDSYDAEVLACSPIGVRQ